jgi:SAM-dependent methyltransferase
MKEMARMLLDIELKKVFQNSSGKHVLDVGGKNRPYQKYLHCEKYTCLDINPSFHPDIVADAHDLHVILSEQYDLILATEVLEHCHTPQQVISEFYRILTRNGTLILSTPFLYPYHPDPKDYYRYTKDGLQELCKKFDEITIISVGNRFLFMWEMVTWKLPLLKLFNNLLASIANYKDIMDQ